MMNLEKLRITKKQQAVILIAGAITIVIAAIIVTYLIIKRLKNKEKEFLKYYAEADRIFWNGKHELDEAVSNVLVDYWKLAGLNFKPSDMQSSSTQNTYPWSAVYISSLVNRSGFKNFKPRTTHSAYTVDAKKHRAEKKTSSFWAFKPSEKKRVEIGDILVGNRSGGNYNLDTITPSVQSHGDIVVDVTKSNGKNYAVIQGGNVSNTVSTSKVLLDSDLTLPDTTKKFAHLKYQK